MHQRRGSIRISHRLPLPSSYERGGLSQSWTKVIYLPIPGSRTRRLPIFLPNIPLLYYAITSRMGRKRTPIALLICLVLLLLTTYRLSWRAPSSTDGSTSEPFSTLVFQRDDIQNIWRWEVASGHHPSTRSIPQQVGLPDAPSNPALPVQKSSVPSRYKRPPGPIFTETVGIGYDRVYQTIRSSADHIPYPPRPPSGSVADLDLIMDHCDFSGNKYVRDCLEVLREGGGLNSDNRLRRDDGSQRNYIFAETDSPSRPAQTPFIPGVGLREVDNAGLIKRKGSEWEPSLQLSPSLPYHLPGPPSSAATACDPDHPRVFHMYWAGPFTDKPYMAILSFLYTQNVGLYPGANTAPPVCRPQFWMWVNPGHSAEIPNPSAERDMRAALETNPWSAPLMHERFHDVVKFKLWNTTEQLDATPELRNEWRALRDSLFNSGGDVIKVATPEAMPTGVTAVDADNSTTTVKVIPTATSDPKKEKLNTVISDMARFVLCHRFGGIYLDADTLLLRDWEDLWGWRGAFAYRWSVHDAYNTAVLKLNKASALGSFLFRTALQNGMDFHPMTITKYLRDAHLEPLLFRIPDALFDSAWLNMEGRQLDRPPQPYFNGFSELFETPAQNSAAPQAMGFDGFFKGAYSYHFHNGWQYPFDPARNWPDLGPRLQPDGFGITNDAAAAAAAAGITGAAGNGPLDRTGTVMDKQDLDWGTVLKRTFEAFLRGERPNMYGEWLQW